MYLWTRVTRLGGLTEVHPPGTDAIPVGSADPGQPWSKPKALFSGSELFEPFWKLFSPVNWRELLHTNS